MCCVRARVSVSSMEWTHGEALSVAVTGDDNDRGGLKQKDHSHVLAPLYVAMEQLQGPFFHEVLQSASHERYWLGTARLDIPPQLRLPPVGTPK